MRSEQTQFNSVSAAACEVFASMLFAAMMKGVSEMDAVTADRHVNEALAKRKQVESLTAQELVRYQKIVVGMTAEKLADAARLATDALENCSGHRVWINAANERAFNLYNRKLADCASTNDPMALFHLLIAQTFLMSTTQALGLLGLPIKGAAKRKPTATRKLLPDDYPDRDIRAAIVETAFGERENGAAYLSSRTRDPKHDRDGRISQLIAAYEAGGDLFANLQALAGRIIAADPAMFTVTLRTTAPNTAVAEAHLGNCGVGITARARAAASAAA